MSDGLVGKKLAMVWHDHSYWPDGYRPLTATKRLQAGDVEGGAARAEKCPIVVVNGADGYEYYATDLKVGVGDFSSEREAEIGDPYGVRDYSSVEAFKRIEPSVATVLEPSGEKVPDKGDWHWWNGAALRARDIWNF